jgi:hypothetical protein
LGIFFDVIFDASVGERGFGTDGSFGTDGGAIVYERPSIIIHRNSCFLKRNSLFHVLKFDKV